MGRRRRPSCVRRSVLRASSFAQQSRRRVPKRSSLRCAELEAPRSDALLEAATLAIFLFEHSVIALGAGGRLQHVHRPSCEPHAVLLCVVIMNVFVQVFLPRANVCPVLLGLWLGCARSPMRTHFFSTVLWSC